jgi:glycosyltransferase involved in cell wall biosynthesis
VSLPSVSIVLPARNEEKFIERSLESILNQDYPQDRLEVVVSDGRSTDRTRVLVKGAERNGIPIRLVDNPKLNQPAGVNAGVREAKGDLIIRMDAHALYASDYVSKCVEVMREKGAGNVGGVAVPVPVNGSPIAGAIALAHLSQFGLGGARFRTGRGYEGETDTVWPGCWKKEVFLKLGGFDERYPRTEDIQFNQRLRETGHKVWLSPRIRAWYFCRGTLRELWKQNWANGKGIVDTLPMNRRAIGLRHLVPLLFVLSILGLLILHFAFTIFHFPRSHSPQLLSPSAPLLLLLAELGLYLLLSIIFSFSSAFLAKPDWAIPGRREGCRLAILDRLAVFLCLPTVFLTLHLSYGVGSFIRLLQVPFVRRMWQPHNSGQGG